MSTDLSKREFPEKATSGALQWLLEGFRIRMRDTAKAVRMEAAWKTWPIIHSLAKSLQERLTTSADIAAEKAQWNTEDNTPEPVKTAADSAHEKDMDQWGVLNAAVGGDLFTNPEKTEIMRRIDRESDGASWEEFEARVIAAIEAAPAQISTLSHDIS